MAKLAQLGWDIFSRALHSTGMLMLLAEILVKTVGFWLDFMLDGCVHRIDGNGLREDGVPKLN